MIFVFGSNLAGRHGAGAARVAVSKHGACYGVGVGLQGNSYAIPTKFHDLTTMPLTRIKAYVNGFLQVASASMLDFHVTRIGCGLAGYRDEDIAPLFNGATSNCYFDEKWIPYLDVNEAKTWGTF